jgi:predicted RNase H-like nuclease (RuvC/YqgF family)
LKKNGLKDIDFFLWLLKMISPPPVSAPVPSHYSSRASQARKDRKEKKEYLKQMSEMAKIVQQQRLENKKLEKLFSDAKRQSLQLSESLSQQQYNPPADPWDKFVKS